MKSWLGDADADCGWLAGRLGHVYPHETVISHIRRGLDHRFPKSTPGETRVRFANRMRKVENYMNSSEFTARDGGGLASLAESLRERCRRLAFLEGDLLYVPFGKFWAVVIHVSNNDVDSCRLAGLWRIASIPDIDS